MDVVENYFAERMDVLSKLEMNSSIKNYLLNDIDYYELDTLIKYRKLQIGDLRFKKINQTVELNNIEVEGDKAKVDVVLDEKITFNDSSDVISEESIEHNLTCSPSCCWPKPPWVLWPLFWGILPVRSHQLS